MQLSECSAVQDELAMHREERRKKPGLCHRLPFPLIEEKKEDERRGICTPSI